MGFLTSHPSKSCVTPDFPKMGFRHPNLFFFQKFRQKALKVRYKVLLSKKSRLQSCSAINYTNRTVLTFWQAMATVPVELGPEGTDPIGRMRVSRFTRGALCSRR